MSDSKTLSQLTDEICSAEQVLALGGGPQAIERQHAKGRLTARERVAGLIDPETSLLEIGLWAGWQMYDDWGTAPGASVITVIGTVAGRRQMIARKRSRDYLTIAGSVDRCDRIGNRARVIRIDTHRL